MTAAAESPGRWRSTSLRVGFCGAAVFFLGSFAPGSRAQNKVQPSLPSDPVALFQLAWQENGLHPATLKPWYAKLAWETLDRKGKREQWGIVQEWWAGERNHRITYTGPAYQRTRWATARGDFLAGDATWPSWPFYESELLLNSPIEKRPAGKFRLARKRIGGKKMECLASAADAEGGGYCFAGGVPAVRAIDRPTLGLVFNGDVLFQGQYLARDIEIERGGMPEVEIHLDAVGVLDEAGEAQLTPPADARAADILVSDTNGLVGLQPGQLEQGDMGDVTDRLEPGQEASLEGNIVVDKSGKVIHAEIVSAPESLRYVALQDLQGLRFRPWTLNGEPAEVRTDVRFNMSFATVIR